MTRPTLERYEGLTALPMLVCCIGFIAVWLAPFAFPLTPAVQGELEGLSWVLWSFFALDYGIRFAFAPVKTTFLKRNVLDLLIVLLPLLAPLRVFSGLRALRVLRALTLLSVAARAQKSSRNILNPQNVTVAVFLVATLALVGAGLEFQFEKGAPHANIRSFGDSIWWAMTTISTVGYGDKYPTTVEGRAIALLLILAGVGATGLLSAGLTTFFVGGRQEQENTAILSRLDHIEALLAASTTNSVEGSGADAGAAGEGPH